MEQELTHLGPQVVSLFDVHLCEGPSGRYAIEMDEVDSIIKDYMDFESAELYEIKVSALHYSGFKVRKSTEGKMVTCSYNPFAKDEQDDRANMLAVASSISAIAWLQASLASQSNCTMIGGSMTFGDVQTDGIRTWGDAVDEAVALKKAESRIYPRMAVSANVERLFEGLCQRHNVRTSGVLGDAIATDIDGTRFVNYLSALSILERIRTGKDEPLSPLTTITQHKMGIESMLGWSGDSVHSDELLRKRYRWLISYHNSVVRYSRVGEEIDPSILDRTS